MATTLSYLPTHLSKSPRKGLRGAFMELVESVLLWQERATQRAALRQMDERLLRDIGVDYADAMAEARKPAWKA